FEDCLDLVMLIRALCFYVEVGFRSISERLEEMEKHFCRHFTYFLAGEGRIPDQPGPPTEVDRRLCQAIVHGQTEPIASEPPFVAQRFRHSLTQGKGRIFDGVVLVNVQVALHGDGQVDTTVSRQLVEHVVEESYSG